MIRIIRDYFKFFDILQPMIGEDYPSIAIKPNSIDGAFLRDRKEELIEFCARNNGYHIASKMNVWIVYNFLVENPDHYYLCYGDSDPNLIFVNEDYFSNRLHSDTKDLLDCQFPTNKKKF